MHSELIKQYCFCCGGDTPQADNNTTGNTCMVCGNVNPYAAAVTYWTWPELAYFWQIMYFRQKSQVIGFCTSNESSPFKPTFSFDFAAIPAPMGDAKTTFIAPLQP